MGAKSGEEKWREDPCLRVVDMSSSASKHYDDEYPDAIMLDGHDGVQSVLMKQVYTRYVPASELNAKSSWRRAKVKRVDFKNDRIDLSVRLCSVGSHHSLERTHSNTHRYETQTNRTTTPTTLTRPYVILI